jgi:DNA-directed RNA polymerase alpha subunit
MKKEYILPSSVGLANALRRSLIMDIDAWAPDTVTFEKNSSCQTDEYIAHRIGMVPFVKIGNGETMKINVKGKTLWASDLQGIAFEAVENLEIMEMLEDQEIVATVNFRQKKGKEHARYKMCAAVGIEKINNENYKLSFETINNENPDTVLKHAINSLVEKVDKALLDLGKLQSV